MASSFYSIANRFVVSTDWSNDAKGSTHNDDWNGFTHKVSTIIFVWYLRSSPFSLFSVSTEEGKIQVHGSPLLQFVFRSGCESYNPISYRVSSSLLNAANYIVDCLLLLALLRVPGSFTTFLRSSSTTEMNSASLTGCSASA